MIDKEKPGLRERKKQKTRLAISNAATKLFIKLGFDNVTVAEVAAAADVSVNTIFNYFATKEELFFDRGAEAEEAASNVVRERQPGESVIDALERHFREILKGQHGIFMAERVRPFLLTIEGSPALKARERLLLDRSEERLAETLCEEAGSPPGDPTARAVAAMITSIEWLLLQEARKGFLRGDDPAKLRTAMRRIGERSFALLRAGIGDYGARTGAASVRASSK